MTMAKKSVSTLTEGDLAGKRVLVRCDLNVPLGESVSSGCSAMQCRWHCE